MYRAGADAPAGTNACASANSSVISAFAAGSDGVVIVDLSNHSA